MFIIGKIKSQEPPGKFIEKNLKTGTWHEVDDRRAYFKTSQALRERVRPHADKRSKSPELQTKLDEMQNFCVNLRHSQHNSVACTSQDKNICGLAEGTISNIIPESSTKTDLFIPVVSQVTLGDKCLESAHAARIKICRAANMWGMKGDLFMNSMQPFTSKDVSQEPCREYSYAVNHTVKVGLDQRNKLCTCTLREDPSVIKECCSECCDISPCINDLNYAEKNAPHRDLHGLCKPMSSLQSAYTDHSDALCEALLAKFIRENLSYDEDEANAGSMSGVNFANIYN